MNDNVETKNKSSHKKAKKRLIIILIVLAAIMALLVSFSLIIDYIESKEEPKGSGEVDYDFYEPDYDEDIFKDEDYLDKIAGGFIRYSKNSVTMGITRETAADHGEEVEFLVEMLYDIIYGDNVSYNAAFSEAYYQQNSPKDEFTMQKLYDVTITFESTEDVLNEDGSINYTKSIYSLKYKIYENNGTFRRDIGEGSKTQYLTISNSSGEWLIDSLITPSYN